MIDFISYFIEQIEIQNKAIKSFKLWMIGLILAGVAINILTFFIEFNEILMPNITRFGGGFIAAISTFPFREVLVRNERINTYMHLKNAFEKIDDKTSQDYKSLVQLAIDVMKESIKR